MHAAISELISTIAAKKNQADKQSIEGSSVVVASGIVDRLLNKPSLAELLKSQNEKDEENPNEAIEVVPAPPKKCPEVITLSEDEPETDCGNMNTRPESLRAPISNTISHSHPEEQLSDDEYHSGHQTNKSEPTMIDDEEESQSAKSAARTTETGHDYEAVFGKDV